MARTFTYTQTKTFARVDLLKMQIRIALRRTTNIQQEALRRLEMGVGNYWIRRFLVYGLDSQNLCRAQLTLEINWNEYHTQLSVGRAMITIDGRWVDDTAIEVEEAVNLFNSFVASEGLKTHWRVQYADWVYADEAMHQRVQSELNLTKAASVTWAGEKHGGSYQVPEIPEFSVGCYLVFDQN